MEQVGTQGGRLGDIRTTVEDQTDRCPLQTPSFEKTAAYFGQAAKSSGFTKTVFQDRVDLYLTYSRLIPGS